MPISRTRTFRSLALAVGLTLSASTGAVAEQDPENTLFIDMEFGRIVIEMRPDLAPNHVERIKLLAREGFYDGVVFHRVIEDFMAQTGDPTGTGTGGSTYPDLKQEFNSAPFLRGTVGMARTPDPNSANSQWFICFDDCSFLNGEYTVWGKVVEGMDVVDQIKKGAGRSGSVTDPDAMVSVRVAADVPQ
ncbi:peptidylprolyl isomerase [Pacificispira sp.]|uniref:peptidylprolyl isomerase n=1 Tax=Pacificispira sp. TaxID=2888761 RepID=UPI003BAB50DB